MSKIYTKTGDKGYTSLAGGTRVPKYHPRIEAYGTIDELSSYLGIIYSMVNDSLRKQFLLMVQKKLFIAGSLLAVEKELKKTLPAITEEDILELENQINVIDKDLKPLHDFVLPCGTQLVSHCHVARCICRRAERMCVKLANNEHVDETILIFLNRLSDYLFVLARKILQENGMQDILLGE